MEPPVQTGGNQVIEMGEERPLELATMRSDARRILGCMEHERTGIGGHILYRDPRSIFREHQSQVIQSVGAPSHFQLSEDDLSERSEARRLDSLSLEDQFEYVK
jgi:hypothetical protein